MSQHTHPGRERDPEFLEVVRLLPCAIWKHRARFAVAVGPCEPGPSTQKNPLGNEAAHVGWRAKGRKCDDSKAISACPGHHRTGKVSLHNGKLGLLLPMGMMREILNDIVGETQAEVRALFEIRKVYDQTGIPF